MSRIKIKDLPKDQKVSAAEMKAVLGGTDYLSQAILPQGEDLLKPSNVQMMGMGSKFVYPYGGGLPGIYSGLFGGTGLYGL